MTLIGACRWLCRTSHPSVSHLAGSLPQPSPQIGRAAKAVALWMTQACQPPNISARSGDMPGPVKPRPSRTSPRDFGAMANFRTGLRSGQVGVRRHRLGSARYLRRAGSRVPRPCSSTGSQHSSKGWGEGRGGGGHSRQPPLTMSSLSSRRVRMIVSATARCFRYPASGALRRVCGLLRKGFADWQTDPAGRSVRAQAQRSKRLFAVGGFASKIPRRLARYPLDCRKTMRLASPEGHAPSPSIHQD